MCSTLPLFMLSWIQNCRVDQHLVDQEKYLRCSICHCSYQSNMERECLCPNAPKCEIALMVLLMSANLPEVEHLERNSLDPHSTSGTTVLHGFYCSHFIDYISCLHYVYTYFLNVYLFFFVLVLNKYSGVLYKGLCKKLFKKKYIAIFLNYI